jgi:ATP-dependent Lon protease
MATALVSLLTGKQVNSEVGMTGEITLRGQVLPVGGIKEKVLAAHRSGLKTVILPKRNEMDVEDLPEEVRSSIRFIYAETVDDVLKVALDHENPITASLSDIKDASYVETGAN